MLKNSQNSGNSGVSDFVKLVDGDPDMMDVRESHSQTNSLVQKFYNSKNPHLIYY